MKVLMLNGSCNPKGCTYTALTEVGKTLTRCGHRTTRSCSWAATLSGTASAATSAARAAACSPTAASTTSSPRPGRPTALYSAHRSITPTPAGGCCPSWTGYSTPEAAPSPESPALRWPPPRRAGTTASLDALGKYFGISDMVTVGSTYWNMVHGHCPEDVMQDGEGLQTMRNPGRQHGVAAALHSGRPGGRVRLPCSGAWSSDELHPLKDAAKRSGRRYAPAAPFHGRILLLRLLLLQRGSAVQRHLGDDGAVHPQEE